MIASSGKEKKVGHAKTLTERDHQVLRWVGQGGVAGLGQLHRRFWPQAKERTAQERLNQLVAAGYMERQYTNTRRPGETVYGLCRKGAAMFSKLEQTRLTVGLPNRQEMKQQLLAQATRLILEQKQAERGGKLVEWLNEHRLRSLQRREQIASGESISAPLEFEDIADAQAILTDEHGETSCLDIEIDGQYYGQMLKNKIASLASSGRPILWVTNGGSGRARRIELEIAGAKASNIEVLVIEDN